MGNIYSNQKSGLTVVMGTIESIANDRLSMVIKSTEFKQNPDTKRSEPVPISVTVGSTIPFEDNYRVNSAVTAVGYGRGMDGCVMQAQAVLLGADIYESNVLSVVKGYVKRVFMNEEKNPDGSPKVNRENQPKKPHFDIVIPVPDTANDRWVDHVIKIYDGRVEPGKRGQIEQMQYRFKDFDPETQRCAITVVTQPAEVLERSYQLKDGRTGTSYTAYHLGSIKMDYAFEEKSLQQTRQNSAPAQTPVAETPQATQPQTAAPTQTAPTAPTTPTPSAPVQETQGNGFEVTPDITSPEMDELELFS